MQEKMTDSTLEDALFWLANKEYSYGDIRQGLWRAALSLADGDESKAKNEYLRLRVKTLHDEIEATQPELIDSAIDEIDYRRFISFRSAQKESQTLGIKYLGDKHNSRLWRVGIIFLITVFVIVCGTTLI